MCDKASYEEMELFIVADIGAAVDVNACVYTELQQILPALSDSVCT